MAGIGVICAGADSRDFTLKLCETCRDRNAQNNFVFIGIHPSGGNAPKDVSKLTRWGFRAATVEQQNTETTDIFALVTLFQVFTKITVDIPDLLMLVLDELFITNTSLIAQSWKIIATFKENNPNTEIMVVYFPEKDGDPHVLDQIKRHYPRISNTSGTSSTHVLLISDKASLHRTLGNEYRHILARQLGILLISDASGALSVSFRQQIQRMQTPFVAIALAEVKTPRIWAWTTTPNGRLPEKVVEDISKSWVDATVNLVNMPTPQASFGRISPAARRNGDNMLAINIFTPPLHEKDINALDKKIERMLNDYIVDALGRVVVGQQPQAQTTTQLFNFISCSLLELIKMNALLDHIPLINRIELLQKHEKLCQIQVLFGIEAP